MAYRDYNIDVYDAKLRICNDKKSAKLSEDDPEYANCAIYGFNGKWWVIIYLPTGSLRTACHESVHGAMSLLDVLGVKPSFDEQEPVAWLTDYIFSRCMEFIEVSKK